MVFILLVRALKPVTPGWESVFNYKHQLKPFQCTKDEDPATFQGSLGNITFVRTSAWTESNISLTQAWRENKTTHHTCHDAHLIFPPPCERFFWVLGSTSGVAIIDVATATVVAPNTLSLRQWTRLVQLLQNSRTENQHVVA